MTDAEEPESLDDWSVAKMATLCTPQQAAEIKAIALMMRLVSEPDPRSDALWANDAGHRWWMYCLDAVARRA